MFLIISLAIAKTRSIVFGRNPAWGGDCRSDCHATGTTRFLLRRLGCLSSYIVILVSNLAIKTILKKMKNYCLTSELMAGLL